MQAAGYVRTLLGSPKHTLYAQREDLRAWARANQTSLVAVFQDEGGTTDRPGLRTLWASLGEFDILVVESLNVLSGNLISQELLIQRLELAGVTVVTTTEAQEEEPPNRVALREVVRNVVNSQAALDAIVAPRSEAERPPLFLEIVADDDKLENESAS